MEFFLNPYHIFKKLKKSKKLNKIKYVNKSKISN